MLFLIAAALQAAAPAPTAQPAPESPVVTTESGLRFQVLEPGPDSCQTADCGFGTLSMTGPF